MVTQASTDRHVEIHSLYRLRKCQVGVLFSFTAYYKSRKPVHKFYFHGTSWYFTSYDGGWVKISYVSSNVVVFLKGFLNFWLTKVVNWPGGLKISYIQVNLLEFMHLHPSIISSRRRFKGKRIWRGNPQNEAHKNSLSTEYLEETMKNGFI